MNIINYTKLGIITITSIAAYSTGEWQASAQMSGGMGGYAAARSALNSAGGVVGHDGAAGDKSGASNGAGGGGGGGGAGGGHGGIGGDGSQTAKGGAEGSPGDSSTTVDAGAAGGGGGIGGNHGYVVGADYSLTQNLTGEDGGHGGKGGNNSALGFAGGGGGGGGGGYGLFVTGNATITNGMSIIGGAGGYGGDGGNSPTDPSKALAGSGGQGGAAGSGLSQLLGGTIINSGTITGGVGGQGGDVPWCCSAISGTYYGGENGVGGRGGDGITAAGVQITNTGVLSGGNGGAAGSGGLAQDSQYPNASYGDGGDGGHGITGSDLTIINSGKISKGLGGAPSTGKRGEDGRAIYYTSGNNSLELHNGYIIDGDVVDDGQNATFILAGNTDDVFADDVQTGSFGTVQYRGFARNIKRGQSVWTLTGTTKDWSIEEGTLQIGAGHVSGAITGDIITGAGAQKGKLVFNRSDELIINGKVSGTGDVEQKGTGTTILAADNTYTGSTTITAGTLQLGNGGTTGSLLGNVTNNGQLAFNHSSDFDFGGVISGSGSLSKLGSGSLTLIAENTYTGGTAISAGILQLGDGNVHGHIVGDVSIATNGTLAFNHSDSESFNGILSGTGKLDKIGSGALTLNGDSSGFTGKSSVGAGSLLVHSTLGGAVDVAAGAVLGGDGVVKGNIVFAQGGAGLTGREGSTLTVEQDLVLNAGTQVNVSLGAPTTNRLFYVKGNLALDGTLNVKDLGGFGPGIYRIFDYDGTLNGTLAIGTIDGGSPSTATIQTSVNNQVNLVSSSNGAALNFWDGSNPANANNGLVDGGNGSWNTTSSDWTGSDGQLNGAWVNDQFAVFTGAAGTVTLDSSGGAISAGGMQFSTDGYKLDGDALTLSLNTTPIIRVDKNVTATIGAELQGTRGFNKTDFGTLILTGTNSYTGDTIVSEGILQLGDSGTTGSITGNVVLARTHYDYGTLAFKRSDTVSFSGTIDGEGEVLQQGDGTVILAGHNSFSGGLRVEKGTVKAGISDDAFGAGLMSVNLGATADLNDFDTRIAGLTDGIRAFPFHNGSYPQDAK